MSLSDITQEVDLLYRSIAQPQYLEMLLQLIRRKTNSCSGSIQIDDYRTMQVLGGVFQGFPDSGMDLYQRHYSKINVLTNAAAADKRLFDRIFISDQLISLREFKESEFYVDWVQPHIGTDYSIWLTLNDNRERVVKLTLQRLAGEQSYSEDRSSEYLARLRPHLRAAVAAVQAFAMGQQTTIELEYLNKAAVLVDQKLKIIKTNSAFENLLHRQSSIGRRADERIKLPSSSLQWLQKIVNAQYQLSALIQGSENHYLNEDGGGYHLKVTPYVQDSDSLLTQGMQQRFSLLTINSLQRQLDIVILRRLFDLTPVEAQTVQGVFQGLSLQQISTDTGRSLHTVRSLLKIIFQKCGASRQAELVAKIAASSAYH